jgi:hypothetical protein
MGNNIASLIYNEPTPLIKLIPVFIERREKNNRGFNFILQVSSSILRHYTGRTSRHKYENCTKYNVLKASIHTLTPSCFGKIFNGKIRNAKYEGKMGKNNVCFLSNQIRFLEVFCVALSKYIKRIDLRILM